MDTLTSFALTHSPLRDIPEFRKLTHDLETDLAAIGPFEITLAGEILHTQWRVRRYMQVDEAQLSEDRQHQFQQMRIRETNSLRRMTIELRRWQSERQVREQLGIKLTGLASSRELVQIAATVSRTAAHNKTAPEPEVRQMETVIHAKLEKEEQSQKEIFTERTQSGPSPSPEKDNSTPSKPQSTARNALCPCNSGHKHKRCCGKNAPPILQKGRHNLKSAT